MRYLGNKTRLSKELKPILSRYLDGFNLYIEPFIGAAGMMQAFSSYGNKIGCDACPYIIALLQYIKTGNTFSESEVTEEIYNQVRVNYKAYPKHLVGFLGYGCSFGGKWFGGYARGGINSNGQPRDYAAESIRNINKLGSQLNNVALYWKNYDDVKTGRGNVIYCDIPYGYSGKTTEYKQGAFNYGEFFYWARQESKANFVYVSEYNAPKDFIPIWSKEHKTGIHHGFSQHNKTEEKLFVYSGGIAYEG